MHADRDPPGHPDGLGPGLGPGGFVVVLPISPTRILLKITLDDG